MVDGSLLPYFKKRFTSCWIWSGDGVWPDVPVMVCWLQKMQQWGHPKCGMNRGIIRGRPTEAEVWCLDLVMRGWIQQVKACPGSLLLGHFLAFTSAFGDDVGHAHFDPERFVVIRPTGIDNLISRDLVIG